jgi:hypothetical protein
MRQLQVLLVSKLDSSLEILFLAAKKLGNMQESIKRCGQTLQLSFLFCWLDKWRRHINIITGSL